MKSETEEETTLTPQTQTANSYANGWRPRRNRQAPSPDTPPTGLSRGETGIRTDGRLTRGWSETELSTRKAQAAAPPCGPQTHSENRHQSEPVRARRRSTAQALVRGQHCPHIHGRQGRHQEGSHRPDPC